MSKGAPTIEAQRDYVHAQLAEPGYASVRSELTAGDSGQVFDQFRDLLDLCDEPGGDVFRKSLAFTPPNRNSGGDYFVRRRRIGEINPDAVNKIPSTEEKDVAHIGPLSLARATEYLGGNHKVPRVMRTLLDSCVEVHQAARTSVRPVLRALGLEATLLAQDSLEDQHVIRLLRYIGTSASYLAELHFDRGVATLAAWESHPGLVGAPGQNAQRRSVDIGELEAAAERADSTPIEHRSGSAKFFLGAAYNRLPDEIYQRNAARSLLLHGVKNQIPGQERFAAVVFMHPLAGLPGYLAPFEHETGLTEVREHILRRRPVHAESA